MSSQEPLLIEKLADEDKKITTKADRIPLLPCSSAAEVPKSRNGTRLKRGLI